MDCVVITFAGFQNKRHTIPALILNVNSKSTECRTPAILRDGIIIQIPWFTPVEGLSVLTDDNVLRFNRRDSSEYTNL